ncbi:MAG: SdpI family protein [Thermoanaerobaculia bacterium]|nr:SdpI family protein [Thermoanaerobaculia bacterium]
MKFAIGIILLVAVVATMAVYSQLPEEMPTHWNAAGEVDGTMAKPWGPFLLPVMMAILTLIFLVLPRISPRGYELEARGRAFRAIVMTVILFMLALHVITLAVALGHPVSMGIAVPVLLGVLLVVMGNYLSKVPRNFFIGVRTPWTLADEDVWFRTHRLAARTFMLGGLAIAVGAPLAGDEHAQSVVLGAVMFAALVPVIYSYAIYKKEVSQ